MAIQVYNMGLDFTKGEGDKPESISDFRKKQSETNQANATANKYRAETDAAAKASALQQTRGAALREAVKQFPDSEDEQFSYLLGAAGANGDTEFHDATLKQRAEFRKGRDEQKKANEDNTVALQKRYSPKFADLERDSSDENIERHIEDLGVTDPEAAAKLKEMYDANRNMPPEERSKRFGEMVHSDYRTLKYNQNKKVNIDRGGSIERIPENQGGSFGKTLSPKDQDSVDNPNSTQSRYPAWEKIRTDKGIFYHNRFTNETVPAKSADGRQLKHAIDDPETRGAVKQEQAAGTETGKAYAKVKFDLPMVDHNAKKMIRQLDEMVGSADKTIPQHSGFTQYVGIGFPGLKYVPGTDTASFAKRHKQIMGAAFAEAFAGLKGGGAISDTEGGAATAALARMDEAQSQDEYIAAVRDFQMEIKQLQKIAHSRAKLKLDFNNSRFKGNRKQPKAQEDYSDEEEAEYQEWAANQK